MAEDDEFDSSPRPVKKRRVTGGAVKAAKKPAPAQRASKAKKDQDNDVDDFIVPDDDNVPLVKPKRGRPRKTIIQDSDDDGSVISAVSNKGANGRRKSKQTTDNSDGGGFDAPAPVKKPRTRKKKQSTTLDSDEDGSVVSATSGKGKGKKNQLTSEDFDEDGFAKPQKPKYSIHVPARDNLKDVYVDMNTPPPSTNPWEIRGAIWKRNVPGVKSVFDVVPVKMAPSAPPTRGGVGVVPARTASPMPGRPSDKVIGRTVVRPAQTKTSPLVQGSPVRPSLARFMAPVPVPQQSDIPDSDDLDPEDWAHFDEEIAKPPVRVLGAASRSPAAEALIPVSRTLTNHAKPAPGEANTQDPDIPDSDELDAEDWNHLNEVDTRSSLKTTAFKPPPPAKKASSSVSHVTNTSIETTRSMLKQLPITRPSPNQEPVDDSILIDDDDIDADDWALLEVNNIEPRSAKAALRNTDLTKEPQPRASLAEIHTVKGSTSRQSLAAPQIREMAKPSRPGPFIEIDSDVSEEDAYTTSRPVARQTIEKSTVTAPLAPTVRARFTETQTSVPPASITDELADLPSDAFDDSDDSSPANVMDEVVYVASQNRPVPLRKPNLAAPKIGLVQTTLFGSKAPVVQEAAPTTTKKHNWPLATQKEAETHHKLDHDAANTWIYPTNLGTIRDYQYNIVARGLFHNLLVALPTGLGKTFIAATVMLNWFRWAPESQIVFVAPTKPLVAQQIDACFNIVGIPRSATVMLTGETKPAIRAEEWKEKRVFFMTPQTIINDLKHGYCDPKRIVLVVVDEAHRATGGYAYVEVIKFLRRFNQSFRVLALTATPGSSVEAVQQVIDGLDISRVEIRTETSIDIRQYVHTRDIDTMKFDPSDEQNLIMELLSKAIQPVLTKLNGQNAYWVKDPMKLTAYGCTMAQRQWAMSDAGKKAPGPVKGMIATIFPVLASLAHGISLLKYHGIGSFHRAMVSFRNDVDGGQTRGKYAKQIRDDENFTKMMNTMQNWVRNPDFLGHPKLEYLRQIVMNHLMDEGENTRIMVFAHWRDSAEEIVRVLKRNEPMVRPHVFVGQAASKGSEGMGQKRQLEVIQQFKSGTYNTLVATSIGEEGLDIGEVDMIICYDASSSPIRMLQRMGRTGRKRKGNIRLLLMRGKEDDDFEKAKDNYEKMQSMISDGSRFTFHDDKSPRILPRGMNPAVDKKVVEIPIENSQAELPEPNRRKRVPKKPPKKFHMPDNVRTGFVNASRMDESDKEDTPRPKAKGKAKKATPVTKARAPTPEPEAVPLPFLEDVVLNKVQERELERKYQYVNAADDGVPIVTAPRIDILTRRFPGPTRLLKHGRATLALGGMVQRIRDMNSDRIRNFKDNLRMSDLSSNVDDILGERESVNQNEEEDANLPELPALPKKGGRKTAAKPKAVKEKAPPKPRAAPKSNKFKTPLTKARPQGRGARARVNSSDMEGDESEPEPTPANMRIGTQGIDLGSDDTMGEEEDEGEPDSELDEFVVGSSAPIEMISSSLPRMRDEESEDDLPDLAGTAARSDVDEEDEVVEQSEQLPVRRRLQNRRQVIADDSDE